MRYRANGNASKRSVDPPYGISAFSASVRVRLTLMAATIDPRLLERTDFLSDKNVFASQQKVACVRDLNLPRAATIVLTVYIAKRLNAHKDRA